MAQRATVINKSTGESQVLMGEPMLDTDEGVLVIQFVDGTSRVFNWEYVTDFYYMTEDEFEQTRSGANGE